MVNSGDVESVEIAVVSRISFVSHVGPRCTEAGPGVFRRPLALATFPLTRSDIDPLRLFEPCPAQGFVTSERVGVGLNLDHSRAYENSPSSAARRLEGIRCARRH